MKFNSLQDTYTLNNGVKIPIIGFGTWQTPDGEVAKESVLVALNAGYRHIDTAKAYRPFVSRSIAIGSFSSSRTFFNISILSFCSSCVP